MNNTTRARLVGHLRKIGNSSPAIKKPSPENPPYPPLPEVSPFLGDEIEDLNLDMSMINDDPIELMIRKNSLGTALMWLPDLDPTWQVRGHYCAMHNCSC